jgi:periplasmic protein TonB
MTTTANQPNPAPRRVGKSTANDRFKERFTNWFWGSVVAATALHFFLFAFLPAMSVADERIGSRELEAIELPPEVEIPPPPEEIVRPATPVVAEAEIDEDLTIAPTTFEENPIDRLPPPPTAGGLSDAPQFTPMDVEPRLLNEREVQRALVREYPAHLRDAGIGGTVLVWFFIDEQGRVQRTQVHTSSGHTQLDQAAVRVADLYRFSPAQNRDRNVPVWIALPIVFQAR